MDNEDSTGASYVGVRKSVATGFICLFLLVSFASILPTSRTSALIAPVVDPLVMTTNFYQGWALFSPNPLSIEANTFAQAYSADGTFQTWWPTDGMNRVNSARHERWRKWETRIRLDENEEHWDAAARYIAAKTASGDDPLVRVRLIRRWSDVPPVGESNDNRTYQEYHFFEWDVASETGRVLTEDDQQ